VAGQPGQSWPYPFVPSTSVSGLSSVMDWDCPYHSIGAAPESRYHSQVGHRSVPCISVAVPSRSPGLGPWKEQ
jgi:hypothetical protein